jgi:hypothetical protein
MKRTLLFLLPLILTVFAIQACSVATSKKSTPLTTHPPNATPNLQATIDEAVVETCGAYSGLPSTEISLSATEMAIEAYLQSMATPIPTEAVENLAEAQLEAMIVERVQMAAKSAAMAADKTVEAVADGTITSKEQEVLYTYWYYSDEVISYADEAIGVYYTVYGDLATGTIRDLKTIDADLQVFSQQNQVVLPILEQIGLALEQGVGQKDKVLRQIETAAETVQPKIADAQARVQTWSASLQPATRQRVEQALAVKPKKVAKTHKAAVNKANVYIKTVKAGFTDQKITQAELTNIAQQGANAAASLTKKGGDQGAGLANSINEITTQIASGQFPAARSSLDSFQAALSGNP